MQRKPIDAFRLCHPFLLVGWNRSQIDLQCVTYSDDHLPNKKANDIEKE